MKNLFDKKLILFISKALALLLAWIFVYELWLKQNGLIDDWLTTVSAVHSSKLLQLLGFDIINKTTAAGEAMFVKNRVLLYIAHSCNGLILYSLFAGFILIYGQGWMRKWAFIVPGIFLIYGMNLLRIMALCIIQLYKPEYLDISHKYIFTIIIYAVIFGFWMIWVNHLSANKKGAAVETKSVVHAS